MSQQGPAVQMMGTLCAEAWNQPGQCLPHCAMRAGEMLEICPIGASGRSWPFLTLHQTSQLSEHGLSLFYITQVTKHNELHRMEHVATNRCAWYSLESLRLWDPVALLGRAGLPLKLDHLAFFNALPRQSTNASCEQWSAPSGHPLVSIIPFS
jgi:hypothetical protein